MDAVLFESRAERALEERDGKSDLCRAFGDNGQPREEGFGVRSAVPRDLCGVERADLPLMIDIPERGLRPSGDRRGAMGGEKDLRLARLQFLDQDPLPIGFKPGSISSTSVIAASPWFCSAMASAESLRVPAPQLASGNCTP